MRILLIMDQSLAESVQPGLEQDGIAAEWIDTVERADFKLKTRSYEAALLDQKQLRGETYSCLLRWRRDGVKAHLLVVLPRGSAAASS